MSQLSLSAYQTKSPVLFTIFNRPNVTLQVFEQIKLAKPSRLYIAADGPHADNPEEALLCKQAREIVKRIDWECEVKTLFKEKNEGCRGGMSSAINWFFSHEEEGIILEDDCVPANSFFRFCDTLLERYRNDSRVCHISGINFQQGKKWGTASYYFSNMTHVWGWASWKRVWDNYAEMDQYDENDVKNYFSNIFSEPLLVESWVNVFKSLKSGELNSWAYQLSIVNYFNNGLTIIPNENMVSNLGFGPAATHTIDPESMYANMSVTEIGDITHPAFMLPEKHADMIVLNRDYRIEERKHKQNLLRYRVKRWFKGMLSNAAAFTFLS